MTEAKIFIDVNSLSDEELELHQKRMQICDSCEYKSDLGVCKKCFCVLAVKTRVKQFHCPLDKW